MAIQGRLLDITVVGCKNLKDTEWISRQDPYVIVEYGNTRYRTRTDTDGGRNPTFDEKFMLPLIEGLREINVSVYNSNTLSADDFIGSGKILLETVLSDGYHDSTWPLTRKSGKRAGEIRVIMHYKKPDENSSSTSVSSACAPVNPIYPPMNPYPPLAYAPPATPVYAPPVYAPPVYTAVYQPSAYPPPPYAPTGYLQPGYHAYPEGHPPQGYPPPVYPEGYPPLGYPPRG